MTGNNSLSWRLALDWRENRDRDRQPYTAGEICYSVSARGSGSGLLPWEVSWE